MSVETITTLIGVVSILLALGGGFGWMIHRIDGVRSDLGARIDGVEQGLGARIDRVDARIDRVDARVDGLEQNLGVRIDGFEQSLGARIDRLDARVDRVADELVEVKIAIARVEGPPRHLMPVR